MPSTDRKLELTAKASMAQPVSQPALCCNGLKPITFFSSCHYENLALNLTFDQFSVTTCSFYEISVSILKHIFLFQLTSD